MYSLIARNVLAPMLDFSRGTRTMKCLKELEESQWWPRDKFLELQNQRLRQLVRDAYDNVPYYRRVFDERALKPGDIQCSADLARLPILNKHIIHHNFDDLLARNLPVKKRLPAATSGSTGEPLMFYSTIDDRHNWGSAASQRAYRWAGYEIGEKCITVWRRYSYPSAMETLRQASMRFLERIMLFDIADFSTETLPFFARKLEDFQPKFIRGYPSAIYLLARFFKKERKPTPGLKAIITSAEQLFDYQRDLLQEVFHCETFSHYGAWELPAIASECPEHSGYHIAAENVIVEVIDNEGKLLPAGEEGRIIATNLHNYAMPFIRYDIGDIGALSDQACPCGRGLPLLAKLSGRTADNLSTRSGRVIPGTALPRKFFAFLGVEQWQTVQESYEQVKVKLVLDQEYSQEHRDKITREVISRYKPILGEEIDVAVEFVDEIPLTRAGKRRVVISNIHSKGEQDSSLQP